MTKQDIYNKMMKQFESGKREWSFEEVANIYERNQNIFRKNKMENKFKLSDKREVCYGRDFYYWEQNIKEFIKIVESDYQEEWDKATDENRIIDKNKLREILIKRAGEKNMENKFNLSEKEEVMKLFEGTEDETTINYYRNWNIKEFIKECEEKSTYAVANGDNKNCGWAGNAIRIKDLKEIAGDKLK